jgi:chemotaxis protein histidine kinase CheA
VADLFYILNDLLRIPASPAPASSGQLGTGTVRPVLVLQADQPRPLVEVEEILGSAELVVKPLAAHLRRDGITGTAIDGMGNVLLLLNLPDLIRRHRGRRATTQISDEEKQPGSPESTRQSILVADDSVFIRQSLLYSLRQAGYAVAEARDGMKNCWHSTRTY